MARKLLDDCFLNDKDRLSHEEALAILRERVSAVTGTRRVPLSEAGGRILAETVEAIRPIPAHDNAAVDGYSFAHSDYAGEGGARLRVSARAAAGHPAPEPVAAGTAARIFTGAVMPSSHDSVVMQEDVDLEMSSGETFVVIPPGLKAGANRRLAGEDVAKGAQLFEEGDRLRPQDLAAIASTGRGDVLVFDSLKVAFFSTGDEIVRPGNDIAQGQVYDANAPMLKYLVELMGGVAEDLGVLPDDAATVRSRLTEAAEKYDFLLTSGGASRGEEDYVVETLDDLGKLHMWQIAVKPGRPMSFGQIGDCGFVGLPGNPVAAFVCFLLYVRPVLLKLSGARWPEPVRFPVKAGFSVPKKKTGRREFWRGMLRYDDDGALTAQKFMRDGSGLISSLREADGLIEVAEDVDGVNEGDIVQFIPFGEFGFTR